MRKYKGLPVPPPRFGPDDDFVVQDYYVYDKREQIMRVTYSLMIISIHIKILNVLSFYSAVAFLVKIMEKLVTELQTFLMFFFFLISMFSMSFLAVDLMFNNGDSPIPEGDYVGLGGIGSATFLYVFRMSVGDMDIATFKNLPLPQKAIAFLVFIGAIVVLVLIFININVQVIEGVLQEVNARRTEEAY